MSPSLFRRLFRSSHSALAKRSRPRKLFVESLEDRRLLATFLGYGTAALIGGGLTDPEDDGNDSGPEDADGNGLFNATFRANKEPTFSNSTGGGPNEAAFDLFDHKVGGGEAKYCCNSGTNWVEADFGGQQYILTHFTIASDNDVGTTRDPDVWQIQGSNDGVNYTTIFAYSVNGTTPFLLGGGSVDNKVLRYDGGGVDFATPAPYSIFRFESTSYGTANILGLSEIEFFGNQLPSAPVDTDPSANEVAEGAASGTPVNVTAFASDPDVGDTVKYALTDSAGGRFAIGMNSGVVTVADGGLLDFETATSHQITVQADDGNGGTSTADFSITVTDVNETYIIDNRDPLTEFTAPGFTNFGTATYQPAQGYLDNIHYLQGSSPAGTATWTFTNLPSGIYRVSATWHPHSNRATDSPFGIIDGAAGGAADLAVQMNQQMAPDDFNLHGADWEDLSGGFEITGSTLAVTLSNDISNPSQYVIADAIRIERVNAVPDIEVSDESNNILVTGQVAALDFGTVLEGSTATRTVTIRNVGAAALNLGTIMPVGGTKFSVDTGGAATSLAAGQSTTFKVVLDTTTAGTYDDTIGIISVSPGEDPDENPYTFNVTGTVNDTLILDNGDIGFSAPGFTRLGSPTNAPQGYAGDIHYLRGSQPAGTATWQFSGLTEGTWQVAATWNEHSNRATDSPFNAYNGAVDTSPDASLAINQQQVPDSFTEAGTAWKIIGDVTVDSGGVLTVTLDNGIADTSKFVIADAIRIQRTPPPLPTTPTVIDNGDVGFSAGSFSGLGAGYFGKLQGYQDDIHYHAPATPGLPAASWTFDNLAPGTYQVAVTWNEHSNRAEDAPFTLAGTTNVGTVHVDQTQAPSSFGGAIFDDGVYWAPLNLGGNGGNFRISGATLTVSLGTSPQGYVIADAVRIEQMSALEAEGSVFSGQGSGNSQQSSVDSGWSSGVGLGSPPAGSVRLLSAADVTGVFDTARAIWTAADPTATERLAGVTVQVTDLPSGVLGLASEHQSRIWLDADAAGHGWNVSGERRAESGESYGSFTPSPDHPITPSSFDLLTALTHELGHILGRRDLDPLDHPHDVMAGRLGAGVRRLPIDIEIASHSVSTLQPVRTSADRLFAGLGGLNERKAGDELGDIGRARREEFAQESAVQQASADSLLTAERLLDDEEDPFGELSDHATTGRDEEAADQLFAELFDKIGLGVED